MATIQIIGFAADDASVRTNAQGQTVAYVTVAENQGKGDPLFVEAVVYGRCAAEAASVKKGDKVTVQGSFPVPAAKIGRDGKKVFLNLKVVVRDDDHYLHRTAKPETVTQR